jgi:hypothetical protein
MLVALPLVGEAVPLTVIPLTATSVGGAFAMIIGTYWVPGNGGKSELRREGIEGVAIVVTVETPPPIITP